MMLNSIKIVWWFADKTLAANNLQVHQHHLVEVSPSLVEAAFRTEGLQLVELQEWQEVHPAAVGQTGEGP
jgi:hypothetical protein